MNINTSKNDTMQIPVTAENYEAASSFIEDRLRRCRTSSEIRNETLVVFEALFQSMLEQGFDKDTILSVETKRGHGEVKINLVFEGKPLVPVDGEAGDSTSETNILKTYEDKVDYSYQYGCNHIHIAAKRGFQNALLPGLFAILAAILVYAVISAFTNPEAQVKLAETFVFPLVKVFSNAMLMVGAPVTFFSLLKNYMDIHILSEKNAAGRRLQIKIIITSVIVIILAIGAGLMVAAILSRHLGGLAGAGGLDPTPSLSELIESLVPSSIFVPFETIMPFPLIFVALVTTYAFCSVGKHFDRMKRAVDACYTLFSRMLHVVMAVFPFFCFLAILYPLLNGGFPVLASILYIIALSAASLVIPAVFYLVRLIAGGVKLGPFLKHLPGLMKENYMIGSAIDAVPFNVRYCEKNYGMDRKRITDKFSILAQINLDGNCYLIMLMSMLFIFMMVSRASWYHVIVIAIMVLFLSFGAPNQPGSILIGTLIIALFLKADVLIPTAVYLEVFFGSIQNMINVLGDVVTVAIEEKHVWRGETK